MDKSISKDEQSVRSQEALEAALNDPAMLAAATEVMRRVAQVLPKSIEQMRKSNSDLAEQAKRVEEEIRRGPRAVSPSGRRPSGRII